MRPLTLRSLTDQEREVIEKLATSRTAPAGQVRRAQLLKHLAQGASAPQAAATGGVSPETARQLLKGFLKGFNQAGLKALEERPRSGRSRTLTEADRGRLVLLAKRPPQEVLGEAKAPCHWTLDTLLEAAHQEQLPIGRTHLWRVLHQEGIRWWQRGRSWLFSDDPELPQKRGTSLAFTLGRRRGAR
jgi:transposase